MTTPTPAQSRAARALLNITRDELSRRSGVSKRAIASYEAGSSQLMRANLQVIRQTFEMMGVEFMGEDGVRLKSRAG
jgi:transcriptional regulator with XRE-family HTH domain